MLTVASPIKAYFVAFSWKRSMSLSVQRPTTNGNALKYWISPFIFWHSNSLKYSSFSFRLLKNVFLCFCFVFKLSCLICLYTFLLFPISQRLPALKLQLSSWIRFLWYSLLGKGQSSKDVLSASLWEPIILRDLNESCWFFYAEQYF